MGLSGCGNIRDRLSMTLEVIERKGLARFH